MRAPPCPDSASALPRVWLVIFLVAVLSGGDETLGGLVGICTGVLSFFWWPCARSVMRRMDCD